MLPRTGERSQRHTFLYVSFGNSFRLASAQRLHRVCRMRHLSAKGKASAGRCPGLRKPLGFQPALTCLLLTPAFACFYSKRPEWGNISIAQGNALGMYGNFTERPVRTKVKSAKVYGEN